MIDSMPLKYEPVKRQRFEIGRTINPLKCGCDKCNYLGCDNYAKKMEFSKYTLKEFAEFYIEALRDESLLDELLTAYIDNCIPKFPRGLYWSPDTSGFDGKICAIVFIRIDRRGREDRVGRVSVPFAFVTDTWGSSETDKKYIAKFANYIQKFYGILTSAR